MDLILSQLQLTQVRACLSNEQQKAQWQKELNDWFRGYETIFSDGKYIVEEKPIQIGCEDFNKTFGTNLKY